MFSAEEFEGDMGEEGDEKATGGSPKAKEAQLYQAHVHARIIQTKGRVSVQPR